MTVSDPFGQGTRVLILGGLGFIGSTLAHRLVSAGSQVTLVDSLIPSYGGNLRNIAGIEERVRVNISDIRDEHSMRYLVQGQHCIFNLAGQTSHLDSMVDPFTDLEINAKAQLSILETCRKFNPKVKLVFASTRQIYGKPDYLPVDEKHLLRPVDVNGINKMAGEFYHILYNNVYGIPACALRLTNTYGPRMRVKDARQTFVGIWIRLILEGKPFEVWGGAQRRDFTYVEDVVDALLLAGGSNDSNGQVFNLGGTGVVTVKELADCLVRVHGSGSFVVRSFPEEQKRIDIGDYYADFTRIQTTLKWKPTIPVEDGLSRTLQYYRTELQHYM